MSLNNPILFNAALSGFVTGSSVTRGFAAAYPSGFPPITANAVAFATKVDTAIPTDAAMTTSKGALMEGIAAGIASQRAITPGLLQSTVDLVISAYQSGAPSLTNVNDILVSASPVVFKPGVPSSGSTYETAAEIATALNAVNGALFVYIDSSIAPCIIPDGVIWDMQSTGSILGLSSEAGSLQISDGGQVRNPSIIDAVTITVIPHTLPSFDYDDWSAAPVLNILNFGSIFYDPSSTAPWLEVPTSTSVESFFVQLLQGGQIDGNSPGGGIALAAGSGGAGSGASIFFVIDFLTTPFPTSAVSGDSTTTLAWNADASGFPLPAWSDFTGVVSVFGVDMAPGVFYTPAVSGNWVGPAPTTVQQALDRIAANTANAHPIP